MPEKRSSRGEILVVDDDPAIRETLSIVLSAGGYDVVCFADAFARRRADPSASRVAALHFPGREPLTRREREVLEQFTSGASNKEAGRQLGISPRTIEDHRANIMKKLGARNAADLVRIVMTASRAS
jgi:FixJ family two-component response regulator